VKDDDLFRLAPPVGAIVDGAKMNELKGMETRKDDEKER
jgi:hypothetical protein